MRLEITRKVRRELDSRFDKEVNDRVAALTAGQQKRDLESLAALNDGQAESILATRHHADDTGRKWLELAAEKGNAEAQFELGQQYFQPKQGNPDYTAAAHWWQLAQVAGHPDAAAALRLLRQRQIPSLANNTH
jgi:TPR repeat protein